MWKTAMPGYPVAVNNVDFGTLINDVYSGDAPQIFAGAPSLAPGQDYVLFLWTSKSGLMQIIGLSQGLFVVTTNASGQLMVARAAATERMVNASGAQVNDSNLQMLLSDLRSQIQKTLGGGK